MSGEWYKDWFASEDYLTAYNHRDDEDARKLKELIIERTRIPRGSFILDAACGAGRHLVQFAAEGYRVIGFDLSLNLLKKAKQNCAGKGFSFDLINADLRNVSFKFQFALIVNLFTSFGYFESDEENFRFVRNACNFLAAEGFYVLDYFNSHFLEKNLIPVSIREEGELRIEEKRAINGSRVIKEITLTRGKSSKRFIESVRIYSPEEIIGNFESAGFKLYSLAGDYEGSDFSQRNSRRMVAFFKK